MTALVKCPACGIKTNARRPVCPRCKASLTDVAVCETTAAVPAHLRSTLAPDTEPLRRSDTGPSEPDDTDAAGKSVFDTDISTLFPRRRRFGVIDLLLVAGLIAWLVVLSDMRVWVNDGVISFATGSAMAGASRVAVAVPTAPEDHPMPAANEGSLAEYDPDVPNEPTWFNLSTGTYNSRIITGRTGARPLQLPVSLLPNGQPIDIIRRPIPGETTIAPLFPERHFSQASLRILLSDLPTDITSLPSVTATAPINLASAWPPWAFALTEADPLDPSIPAPDYLFPVNTSLLNGFLKVEMQTAPGTWIDVTTEILNLGYVGAEVRGDILCSGGGGGGGGGGAAA